MSKILVVGACHFLTFFMLFCNRNPRSLTKENREEMLALNIFFEEYGIQHQVGLWISMESRSSLYHRSGL